MASTYELLGVTTADSSSPMSLSVGTIAQTHDDLEIIALLQGNTTSNFGTEVKFRINGVSTGVYNYGRYRNKDNVSAPTSTLSGDNGIAVAEGVGGGTESYNYSATLNKLYIAGYTEASGGTPETGFTCGTLVSSMFYETSYTMEVNNCHWTTTDASCDPVTQISVHTTVGLIENSILAVYGIKRS